MLYDSGVRFLDGLERRFGRLAFPNLLRWIALFQVLVYLLEMLSPGFMDTFDFSPKKIFEGEVWRLFSFILFPRSSSILFFLLGIYWMFIVNEGLEGAWGSFRTNIYTYATILLISFGALGLYLVFPFDMGLGFVFFALFYGVHFLAYCTLYSEHEIRLFFVIPLKLKWLGVMIAAFTCSFALRAPALIPFLILIHLPYFAVFATPFIRNLKQASANRSRREKFARDAKPDADSFHVCKSCGKTEHNAEPDEEFRVAADGEEYCETCLEARKSATADS